MTTQLLRQIHEQDQAELAERHNGTDRRQPRRIWCVEALKPELTEQEYAAALRAVKDSGKLFRGRDEGIHVGFQMYRDDATGMLTSGKEQSELKQSLALCRLYALRQAVAVRCDFRQAANMAEWIVAKRTLVDLAEHLRFTRFTGTPRRVVPDTRPVRPMLRIVLLAMADYYDASPISAAA